MTTYAPPPPPLHDGELTVTANRLRIELMRGRYAGCCMCKGPCFTWWSAAPPSAYVPLHNQCAPRLVERWQHVLAEGGTEPEKFLAPPSGRRGAYAQRAATVTAADAVPVPAVRLADGAMLPPGFTPGPFWQPGDDEHTPWTVLLETAAGHTFCPAGPNRAHAEKVFGGYRSQPQINFGPVIVGAALIGPDGAVLDSWGSVPQPDRPRWASIRTLSEWVRCPSCDDPRWPGSWVTIEGGWCPDCQLAEETDDPRPWPAGADHPGEARVPESFTAAKKIRRGSLPAAARQRFRPNLRSGFTSPRRKG